MTFLSQALPSSFPVRLLNGGCGAKPADGGLKVDRHPHSGVDLAGSLRQGLPLPDGFDGIAAKPVLQDLPWAAVVPALKELCRRLRPPACCA